jgi:hypothetical protein
MLSQLFNKGRHVLVHAESVQTEPIRHPSGHNSTYETAFFTAEFASKAVGWMLEVFQTGANIHPSNASTEAVAVEAVGIASGLPGLEAGRPTTAERTRPALP